MVIKKTKVKVLISKGLMRLSFPDGIHYNINHAFSLYGSKADILVHYFVKLPWTSLTFFFFFNAVQCKHSAGIKGLTQRVLKPMDVFPLTSVSLDQATNQRMSRNFRR